MAVLLFRSKVTNLEVSQKEPTNAFMYGLPLFMIILSSSVMLNGFESTNRFPLAAVAAAGLFFVVFLRICFVEP